MAKAIIEFDLSDPDERMEHLRCIKSLDMALAIWKLVSESDFTEKDNKKLFEILDRYGINIDELVI